jgi:hypothetical protein
VADAPAAAPTSAVGDANLAPFGWPQRWSPAAVLERDEPGLRNAADGDPSTVWAPPPAPATGECDLGIQWDLPRDIRRVVVRFAPAAALPDPADVVLQYWFSAWPNVGRGGWKHMDDPFNGKWLTPKADLSRDGAAWSWRFKALSREENPEIEDKRWPYDAFRASDCTFRQTLKVRVLFKRPPPPVAEIEACSDSRWETASVDVEPGTGGSGRVEVQNGAILGVESLPAPRDVAVTGLSWKAPPGKTIGGIRIRVRHVENPDPFSPDHTIVTVRSSARPFSFLVTDVLTEGTIAVRDIGAFVARSDLNASAADWKGPASPRWEKTIRERVKDEPEQSLARAVAEIPRMPDRWVPLGVHANRQEPVVSPEGHWAMYGGERGGSLWTDGRDKRRCPWLSRQEYRETPTLLGTGAGKPAFDRKARRRLEEGTLPLIHVEWNEGPLLYHHQFLVTLLSGSDDLENEPARDGAEPVVLLTRLAIRNTGGAPQEATVWLRASHETPITGGPDGIVGIAPGGTAIEPGLTPVWCLVDPRGAAPAAVVEIPLPRWGKNEGGPDADLKPRPVVKWTVTIPPGEERVVSFKDPFIELLDAAELERLKALRFEDEAPKVLAFWRQRLDAGMQIRVPDRLITEFYRSNLWRVLITTDRDPDTKLYNHGAGTFRYPVYANETCMVARSLEMRGEHEEAARYLEPMLHYQGDKGLPGNFKTKEGVLYSAGPYTAHGYNMHHAFVLWQVAEHWLWTRDRAYLDRVAPALLKGCDWVIAERQATKRLLPDGRRAPEYGLFPAGDLEDVSEYLYWYATNAYNHLGLLAVGEALRDIGHPEAARILREAEEYRADILASVRETTAASPVVRLRNGYYIPYSPPRTWERRHLTEGWIREALYGCLYLFNGRVVEPEDELITWNLDDLEDNLFVRPESGYPVRNLEKDWFSHGGFTLQPNLTDNALAYLLRDEIPNFVRAFYNIFSVSLHHDVRCYTEWVPSLGKHGGPVYKTPDECKFLQWLRQALVYERDGSLYYAMGTPRAWLKDGEEVAIERAATFFGTTALRIRSFEFDRRIEAEIELPSRNRPKAVTLRLRHPSAAPMKWVTLDGAAWSRFDPAKETIEVSPERDKVKVVAGY